MRITLQPAFVLHHRPYRETSVLVDLLTEEYGRVTAVAKGVRQPRSRLRSLIQPFVPLLVSWQGKGELVTLVSAEANGAPNRLAGNCLLSGLYLNELLVRLLQKHDPHPQLYTIYSETLLELQGANLQQKTLRLFEKRLLEELGYGLPLKHDAASREQFCAGKFYRFHPEHGFELCEELPSPLIFSGASLLALAAEELHEEMYLRDAKRLMRIVMAPLLGPYQLNSRRLFIKTEEIKNEIIE